MSSEPPPTEPAQTTLVAGRYRVERPIGTGGMGEVMRAFDVTLRRPVALKRLLPMPGTAGARIAARLLREARSVAILNHPNVVSVYDVGEENGVGFVVMELVEGGNLRSRIPRGSRTSTAQALDWLIQIAEGLACAHRAGLVHRDVKPENLLLATDGRLKVADFGAVKEVERASSNDETTNESAPLTVAGSTIGTPRYMAPEQLRAETVDGRADQFAWGLVAYELLAGIHPFDATVPETSCQAVVDGLFVPPPIGRYAPDVLPGIERVIVRALAAEARERYADMGALIEALAEGRKGTTTTTQTEPLAKPLKLPVTAAAAAAAMATATATETVPPTELVPGGAVPPPPTAFAAPLPMHSASASQRPTHPRPRVSAVPPTVRRRSGIAGWLLLGGLGVLLVLGGTSLYVVVAHRATADATDSADAARPPDLIEAGPPRAKAPPPLSRNASAMSDYESATTLRRSGARPLARIFYARALNADHGFVQARVHLAWLLVRQDVHAASGQFGPANTARGHLRAHELPLLEALEPLLVNAVPDLDASRAVLERATTEFPRDADLACTLGVVRMAAGDLPRANEAFDRCRTLDPQRQDVEHERARILLAGGREREAEVMLDACVSAKSGSGCLDARIVFRRDRGRCGEAVEDSLRLVRENELNADANYTLAESRFGNLDTRPHIDWDLGNWLRTSEPKRRPSEQIRADVVDALVDGDVRGAAARMVARIDADELSQSKLLHDRIVGEAAVALEEIGDTKEAVKRGEAYFSRQSSWSRAVDLPDDLLLLDPTPRLLRAKRQAKLTSLPEAEATLSGHAAAEARSVSSPVLTWLWGAAVLPTTRAEASAALAAAKQHGIAPRTSSLDRPTTALTLARLHALAGDDAAAERFVREATSVCPTFAGAVQNIDAWALQGEILARRGETEGACKAFAHVLLREREGASATRAHDGLRRLTCAKDPLPK